MNSAINQSVDNWMYVCPFEDIPRMGARVVQASCGNIAIFRTSQDELYALEDKCPHRGGPLSQGIVFSNYVACPLHDRVFHLDSGCARAPDKGCVRSFELKIDAGDVYLALDGI